jgi:tetratricopeptide (TPR) repeat protein
LEAASELDPIQGLDELLARKFLVERADERIDFSHQVARQVAYDMLNALERRRCHLHVAQALEALGRAEENPRESAFHFGLAGQAAQPAFARYSVLAGERMLRTFGFRQALTHFDDSLAVLQAKPDEAPELIERALLGRALAYESLLDSEGVSEAYRRLQNWAAAQGNRALLLTIHSRLASMLTLLGRQHESNQLLHELLQTLASTEDGAARSRVLADLLARRRMIFDIDSVQTEHGQGDGVQPKRNSWPLYVVPPEPVENPVQDLLSALEPAYTVLLLIDYGWTLLVQGRLAHAIESLEGAVRLARETGQTAIATVAYHQLALAARLRGDAETSRQYNDLSIATNREVSGVAAELLSMWPLISSAFLALEEGRLDEAERRLQRVVDFLQNRSAFDNYRTSANIGLGLVALARGARQQARLLLEQAIVDPVNLYPYTHVRALLGLARIRLLDGDAAGARALQLQALRFAAQRSLLDEYVETLVEINRLMPDVRLPPKALAGVTRYAEDVGARRLVDALKRLSSTAQTVETSTPQP